MMQHQFGLKPKGQTLSYKRSYLEWYDLVALPHNYRILEFTKFTGQDITSTIEHISQYITQFGEASVEDAHRVRFFSLSLSGPTFTWFSSMPANSIANWSDLEKKFHSYFYARIGEKNITDLADLRQRSNESGVNFLKRFRETKNLCFSMNISDDQLIALAVRGMLPELRGMLLELREKLIGHEIDDQLIAKG